MYLLQNEEVHSMDGVLEMMRHSETAGKVGNSCDVGMVVIIVMFALRLLRFHIQKPYYFQCKILSP